MGSPLLAEEAIVRTPVMLFATVAVERLAIASAFVQERKTVLKTISIGDNIPVVGNIGKLNCSPSSLSLPAATVVRIDSLTSKAESVSAVFLSEPLDVDSRGHGGKGKDDRVTHIDGMLMILVVLIVNGGKDNRG